MIDRTAALEKTKVYKVMSSDVHVPFWHAKVDAIYNTLISAVAELDSNGQASKLQESMDAYFVQTEEKSQKIPALSQKQEKQRSEISKIILKQFQEVELNFRRAFLKSDIRAFLKNYWGNSVENGRQAARIFHGISSPCFPAVFWAQNCRMWGKHTETDFTELVQLFKTEILNAKNNGMSALNAADGPSRYDE